ncbi:hypothetical protein ACW9HW_21355, partial [Pseudomonas sp. SDO5532_S415]
GSLPQGIFSGHKQCVRHTSKVGASLLAMAAVRSTMQRLIHRHREQALLLQNQIEGTAANIRLVD